MKKMLCVLLMCFAAVNIVSVHPTTAYVTAISATCTNTFVSAITPIETIESTTFETTTQEQTQTSDYITTKADNKANKSLKSPNTGNRNYLAIFSVVLMMSIFILHYKKKGRKNNG